MDKPENTRRTQSAIFTEIAYQANCANGWLARADIEGAPATGPDSKAAYIAWMKARIRTLLDEPAADATDAVPPRKLTAEKVSLIIGGNRLLPDGYSMQGIADDLNKELGL